MSWYAIDALSGSIVATRDLLSDTTLGSWLELVVLVFFVGGISTTLIADFNLIGTLADARRNETVLGGDPTMIGLGVVGGGIALLGFVLVGAIAEFVFLETLRTRTVRLRAYGSRWWQAGVRLFGFRLGVFALAAAVLAVTGWLLGWQSDPGDVPATTAAVVLTPSLLVAFVVDRFTRMFVVPIVLVTGCSITDGWRTFLPTLREQWRQFAVYALVDLALVTVVTVLGGLVGAFIAAVMAVPVGLFALAIFDALVTNGLTPAIVAPTIGALVALPYLFVTLVLGVLVHVPVVVYVRYVALLVLGDANDRYDPISRVRAVVRVETARE